jgi:HK97 family phage portal protein
VGGDGLNGYSVIGFARKSFESGMMADEFAYRFYKNDARPGIVLQHPGELSDDAHNHLRDSWEEVHGGVEKSHRVAILEEGMTLHEVGMPLNDAQFIETRNFQIADVARWFRMQPHQIGHMENATFSNIEHQSIEHVVDTIQPWARRWEQSIRQTLILPAERPRYYAEFLLDALLRGDTATRYGAYAQARQNGWLSANDIRRLENMNPVVQLNQVQQELQTRSQRTEQPRADTG